MTTLETLNRWLADAPESEHLEFKEAKQQYDTTKLLRYCVALANEGGGHLVLGVSDKRPRQVVGTQAFQNRGEITARILEALRHRFGADEAAVNDWCGTWISAGFDAHREDDMGQLGMTENDFAWITSRIKDIARRFSKGRIVSSLEGGYVMDPLARSVEAHLRVLADI